MIAWLASWPHELAVAWTVGASAVLGALVLYAELRDEDRRRAGRRVSGRPATSTRTASRRTRAGGIR